MNEEQLKAWSELAWCCLSKRERMISAGERAKNELAVDDILREVVPALIEEVSTQNTYIRILSDALADCVNVLSYIGSGVTAHSMAKEYANRYRDLLTEDELEVSKQEIKNRRATYYKPVLGDWKLE